MMYDSIHRHIIQIRVNDLCSILDPQKHHPKFSKALQTDFTFYNARLMIASRNNIRARFAARKQFISKEGVFASGLLREITDRIHGMGFKFTLQDERKAFYEKIYYNIVQKDSLGSHVELHDYQIHVANLALECRRGIIKCATGGGKTLIFTSILKVLDNKYPAVMLCKSKSIVDQTYDTFIANGLKDVGRVHMDYLEPNIITCLTAQSSHKIQKLFPYIKVLLVDEVHEWTSAKSEAILKQFPNACIRLGFSATPFNNDKIHDYKVMSWLGSQICDISVEYLQDRKILATCVVKFHPVDVPKELCNKKNPTYLESEQLGIVDNIELQKKIVEIVDSIPSGRILILVKRLQQGDVLNKLIPSAYWIRGEDDAETRSAALKKLTYETNRVVVIMSSIGFYGLNVVCHHLINACGGKDANMMIQKIGRGLRKGVDKHILKYHDFYFYGNKYLAEHSKIRRDVLIEEGHYFQE